MSVDIKTYGFFSIDNSILFCPVKIHRMDSYGRYNLTFYETEICERVTFLSVFFFFFVYAILLHSAV